MRKISVILLAFAFTSDCIDYCWADRNGLPNTCQTGKNYMFRCLVDCSDECLYPEYVCPVDNFITHTSILILNTQNPSPMNRPTIINALGQEDTNFQFILGENTQVHKSCSITWRNEFYIFGGSQEKRQLSKVVGCELKRNGSLSFDHKFGGCANVADKFIYLCFSDSVGGFKKCRGATSPTGQFEDVDHSVYEHRWTRIAASRG